MVRNKLGVPLVRRRSSLEFWSITKVVREDLIVLEVFADEQAEYIKQLKKEIETLRIQNTTSNSN